MKLPTNDEIRVRRNIEVKNEIDSGVQLAKRIDSLRELHSKEEKSLNEFREKTVTAVTSEISQLIGERDSLKNEVVSLEERRRQALIPLDEEWDKVTKSIEECDEFAHELDIREVTVDSREKSIDTSLKEIARRLDVIEQSKKAQDLLTSEAARLRNEAQNIKDESLSLRKEFDEYKERVVHELNEKTAETEAKRRDMQIWHDNLAKRQKEQDDREKLINDKYATLERSIKRLTKQ